MNPLLVQNLATMAASLLVAALVAWAAGTGGGAAAGVPAVLLCAAVAFVVQWVAFIPAYRYQTEHYYDLVGSLTHITTVLIALWLSTTLDARSWVLALLIWLWAGRLGTFLFHRVRQAGSDRRFSTVMPVFTRFLTYWTTQGLWVFLTQVAALTAITNTARAPLGWVEYAGIVLWALGFCIEVTADRQKRTFRRNPDNAQRFITTGLWSWCQHPNYFGEIMLWAGIALIAAPVLAGWQWVAMVSPLFVFLLLTRVSGIPMLQASARERWGADPEYRAYVQRTPLLLPKPTRPA